jgi:hypothetical protein
VDPESAGRLHLSPVLRTACGACPQHYCYDRKLAPPFALIVLIGLGAILLVVTSDFLATGSSLSLFFLVPILFVAWFVNRRAGFIVSLAAVSTALLIEVLSGYPSPSVPEPYVNALLRGTLFIVVTVVVSAIKEALDREKAPTTTQ